VVRGARFVLFVVAWGFGLGCWSFASAPQSVFPAISLARVEVFADAGDLSPEQVRASVADPLERALASIPGVRATRSYSDQGKLEVELDFDPRGNVEEDLHDVQATIAEIRERLPIQNVTALIEGPNMEPIVSYALRASSVSQSELRKLVEGALLPAFAGTVGLARVTVFGGPRIAFDIDLEPAKLRAIGSSAREVANEIAAAAQPQAAGTIVRGRERLLVVPAEGPRDFGSLAALGIPDRRRPGTVALSSLGRVRVRDESTNEQASFDAVHAVIINAYPEISADAVRLKGDVERRLPALLRVLPHDTTISIAWDQTRLILASQRGLREEMAAGALLALAIIYLFLRNRALTLAAAVVLPLAIALTVLLLVGAGLSLNLMTIGGLAIAIGLAIDEAIVVVEAIARETAVASGDVRPAIERAVRRIARPLLAATAANVVVFLPLGYLSGIPGFFFRALSITLGIALVVSIALSLFVAPLLACAFGLGAARTRAGGLRLEKAYVVVLRWSLRRAWFVYGAAVCVFVVTALMLVRLPTDFLPSVDEGQFEIKYALPAGMSLDASDALATGIERAVLADPAVAHEARLSGVDTNGYVATPPDAGTIRVILRPGAPPFDVVAGRLRIAIANVNQYVALEVHQLLEDQINDLTGAPEPIQLNVRGPKGRVIGDIATRLADHISDLRGVVDAFDGVIYEARTIAAIPRPGDSAAGAGAFASDLRARTSGIVATTLDIRGASVPVVVRLADRAPLDRAALLGAPQLVTQVQEENGVRIDRVTAGIEDADLSTVIARIRHQISYDLRRLPPGYSIEIGGAVEAQQAAFREFALVLATAVTLVFAVLVLAFDSYRLPLVILAAIPLSPIGVACALALTHTPINVSSFMGMLLLVGIVVRNGILLIDGANRRRLEGQDAIEALEQAALERLRPILMTTCAALGALLPLAIGIGSGSEMARPLAIAVAGGLTTATAFTLILIPVLYWAVTTSRASLRRGG
jgi:multidrug efflux pump subunit AcrB